MRPIFGGLGAPLIRAMHCVNYCHRIGLGLGLLSLADLQHRPVRCATLPYRPIPNFDSSVALTACYRQVVSHQICFRKH